MNFEQVLKRSFKNCHATGVHSIVLDQDANGYLKRAFLTDETHVLWQNRVLDNSGMTIALHSHHCDIEIQVVEGEIYNMSADVSIDSLGYQVWGWKFESQITNGSGKFVKTNQCFTLDNIQEKKLVAGETLRLKANEHHTVFVEKGKKTSWIIQESKEDPNYDNTCYSNNDLTKFDFSGLYKPFSKEELLATLESRDKQLLHNIRGV